MNASMIIHTKEEEEAEEAEETEEEPQFGLWNQGCAISDYDWMKRNTNQFRQSFRTVIHPIISASRQDANQTATQIPDFSNSNLRIFPKIKKKENRNLQNPKKSTERSEPRTVKKQESPKKKKFKIVTNHSRISPKRRIGAVGSHPTAIGISGCNDHHHHHHHSLLFPPSASKCVRRRRTQER